MPEVLGQYHILRELGSGAFGTVYLAEGETPRRGHGTRRRQVVAIKQLKDPGDAKARANLVREFELMERVRHRSLVRVFEFLDAEDAVVMEVVRGATLDKVSAALHAAGETMPAEVVLDIGMELVDCLYQAYSTPGPEGAPLQLVHRDLKPENVMLTPTGEVKILDFGLARARRPGERRDRAIQGTPLYMAPEQAQGKFVDHRTDLFAVGLILFEGLTGRSAYEIDEDAPDPEADILGRIERGGLSAQIAEVRANFSGIGKVVGRCLAADPRDRPVDGHEVMLDLQRLQARGRGAALTEFCDTLFRVHLPLPDHEGEAANPGRPARPDTKRRPEAMSTDKPPRPGGPPRPTAGGPPRPGGPPGPPAPGPGAPRPPGVPPAAAGAPGGPPRPGGAAPPGGPPRPGAPRPGPPSGGPPAPRAAPPGPPSKGAIGPSGVSAPPAKPDPKSLKESLSKSQGRSSEEDGLLEMVKLTDEDDDEEDGKAPKSATAFFQIPKAARAKSAGSAPALPGSAGSAPKLGGPAPKPGAFPGGPPPMMGPGGPPPVIGGPGVGMISGPVSGGISGPGAGGAPFAAAPEDEPDIAADIGRNRARSWVTLAIVGVMVLTLLGAITIAGAGAAYFILTAEDKEEGGGADGDEEKPKKSTEPEEEE